MKRALLLPLLLAACGSFSLDGGPDLTPPPDMLRPMPRPGDTAPPPPANAVTASQFDTTSAEDRAAAVASPPSSGQIRLGETVATLGNPADPGFWLETPLVKTLQQGRVTAPNGKSVKLDLRPIDAPKGSGSRISLPALRLLGLPLAGLHEVTVFSG